MPSISRASFCLLMLSLSLVHAALARPQASSSAAELAARELVGKYFLLYMAEDLDGVMSLWSEKSPDYGSFKQSLQRQFADEDSSAAEPVISRFKVEADKAGLRATANLTTINRKSGQKRERRMARNFALVKEGEAWKVWRVAPAEEDLAAMLADAKTEAAQAALLADEKELATAELARALVNQGGRFYDRGQYPQALSVFNLAQNLAEQAGDQSEVARVLRNIGHVHRSLGNHAQAMECFQKSLSIYETLNEPAGIGLARMGIGLINVAQGDYTQALEHYQKSLTIFESLNNQDFLSRVLNNLGTLYRHQGDYAQALDYYARALAIHQERHNQYGIVTSLGNMGVIYSLQGNMAMALDYYQKSLTISEAEDDKEGIAITLGNIGVVHRKQGNYAQALDYYQKSLAVSEAIDDKVGIAQMLNNIGGISHLEGDEARALACYQKSLQMREAAGDKSGSASTMMAIGVIYTTQGDYARAAEYYQKSLAVKEAIRDKDGIAHVLLEIAIDHKKQGHDAQVLAFAERAAAVARQVGNLEVLWGARVTAGLAHRALNHLDQARTAFEEAIVVIETMRAQVAGGEPEQQRFFEDKLAPYHAMVDLLVAQNRSTEALIFTERARARALLDLLYGGRINIVKAMTGQEQKQERALRTEIISLNTQVARASQEDKADPLKLDELKSRREKVRLNYEAFQTSLYAAHPELKVQRGETPIIKAEELAALLPDAASALFEYVVGDDHTYLFAITKAAATAEAEVRVYRLAIKRAELAKQIEAFRGQMAGRDLGFRASATKLYDLLLKPAEAQLRGKTNLVIAPDDTLWDLPFQALLTGAGRFLIEDAAIAFAPSLTVLREMKKRPKHQGASDSATLLALGNPLPGKATMNRTALVRRDAKLDPLPEAEQEVTALRRLYGAARSKVYVGAEAREDRVKSEAGQASIIHFATHGMLNNASPMYSHLVLAEGGANEDGLLEAWEMMRLDLKADLAVLSACETARGRIGAGEGMIGLSWAMFIAGVPATVVSQWKVESLSTRDLMVNFHRALLSPPAAGKAKPTTTEALRQAALKLMKQPETSHPFYWAGFVLVGDGR